MCCKHTSFSGFLSQRCCSHFGPQKNELATGSDMRVHTMFVTGGWNMAVVFPGGHLPHSAWPQSHPLCNSTVLLLTRKKTKLVGGKYNKTIQHTHRMPRTICFCFKPASKAHSTLGAPVFIYPHFFSDLNYLCKQKKTWGITGWRSTSEYFKDNGFFFSGQLSRATLLKMWL